MQPFNISFSNTSLVPPIARNVCPELSKVSAECSQLIYKTVQDDIFFRNQIFIYTLLFSVIYTVLYINEDWRKKLENSKKWRFITDILIGFSWSVQVFWIIQLLGTR